MNNLVRIYYLVIYVPTILYNGIRTICNVTTHPIPDAANGEIMYTALSAYNRVYIGTLSINFAKTFVKYLMIKDFVLNVYRKMIMADDRALGQRCGGPRFKVTQS